MATRVDETHVDGETGKVPGPPPWGAGCGRTLSIIVPAFNEEVLLPRALEAIHRSSRAIEERHWAWELIVCDNNSRDRTSTVAREWGAKVVFEPVNQIGRARNTGASEARGEWLLFLDADTEPSPRLLGRALDRITAGGVLFMGARVSYDGSLAAWARGLVVAWNWLSRSLRWMAGSFVLVEAAAFREMGGFNLDLYAGEEVDLSRRLKRVARRRGLKGVILDEALVSSARRIQGQDAGKVLRFVARAVGRPWATVKDRKACSMWYEGREPREESGREP